MQGVIEAATSELMRALERVRRNYPDDHPVNAERWLKEAFSTLNGQPYEIITADALCAEYVRIR